MASPRRSSRRQLPIQTTGVLSQWRHLNHMWRQQYIDFGHVRIERCSRRLRDATETQRSQLKDLGVSFVALAITSTASCSGRVRFEKERDLQEYVSTALQFDLNVNDDHTGENAVMLAAYHGLTRVLIQLLDAGCPLQKNPSQRNPIFGAIRNGQHEALETILSTRITEAVQIIKQEEEIAERSGKYQVSLQEVIMKEDVISAQLLFSHQCVFMSDRIIKFMYKPTNPRLRYYKKLEKLLQTMYPSIINVKHWCKELHWSFPSTDRETLNWLWYALQHPSKTESIPSEMWLRVFSYFGRGWFACRRYNEIGRSNAAIICEQNIIIE